MAGYSLFDTQSPWLLAAQTTEGEVTYTETVQLKIDVPEGDREMMKMLPTSQSAATLLLFSEKECLYQDKEAGEGTVDVSHEQDGGRVVYAIDELGRASTSA